MRPHVIACVDASSTTEGLRRSGQVLKVTNEVGHALATFADLAVKIDFELLSELVHRLVSRQGVFEPYAHSPKIALIVTNGHSEDGTSRIVIEEFLQRLPLDTYVLFATLPSQDPALSEWMKFLETRHPNAIQIGVVWFHRDETTLDALHRTVLPWLKSFR